MSDKPNVATPAEIDRVLAAIHANGGNLERLQATQIANQIKRGTVPFSMICIVTGEPKSVAQRALREKRLEAAEGNTPQEKLFNLLTSYKSLGAREKKGKTASVQPYKPSRSFGPESLEGKIGKEKLAINEAVIFTAPDKEGNVRRLSIKNGEIVKDEKFENLPEAPPAVVQENPELAQPVEA